MKVAHTYADQRLEAELTTRTGQFCPPSLGVALVSKDGIVHLVTPQAAA